MKAELITNIWHEVIHTVKRHQWNTCGKWKFYITKRLGHFCRKWQLAFEVILVINSLTQGSLKFTRISRPGTAPVQILYVDKETKHRFCSLNNPWKSQWCTTQNSSFSIPIITPPVSLHCFCQSITVSHDRIFLCHKIKQLDGKTTVLNTSKGPIDKMLVGCQKLLIFKFISIDCQIP